MTSGRATSMSCRAPGRSSRQLSTRHRAHAAACPQTLYLAGGCQGLHAQTAGSLLAGCGSAHRCTRAGTATPRLQNILQYATRPLVSSDIIGNACSSIFDSGFTQVSQGASAATPNAPTHARITTTLNHPSTPDVAPPRIAPISCSSRSRITSATTCSGNNTAFTT